MIHTEILSICLNYEHYNKVRRFIDKGMFNRDYGIVYTLIEKIHDKYPEKILTLRELKVILHADGILFQAVKTHQTLRSDGPVS